MKLFFPAHGRVRARGCKEGEMAAAQAERHVKKRRWAVGVLASTLAVLAVTAVPASAAITLVNRGFETGTTAGWSGTGSAATQYAGYTAPAGTHFGLVRSTGCPGERLAQTFTAAAGDTLTGWAFFKAGDYLPYNDNGDVKVVITPTGSTTVLFSSSVAQTGDYGGTPWRSFSYTIPAAGSYSLQARIDNSGDCGVESAVGLDMADPDIDGDGVLTVADNCPLVANPGQANHDDDPQGNACDADDDNDTVDDTDDAFPLNGAESVDTDADGTGNNADADDDGDGAKDGDDAFPLDPAETTDTDGDGTGNHADNDDDGDGIDDAADSHPLDPSESTDTDGDGTGNNADNDDDGDGVNDGDDAFPTDPAESVDTDGDGTGNHADSDDDGDGVNDGDDAFPLDGDESIDTDGDGTGNSADADDDNDGVGDAADACGTQSGGANNGCPLPVEIAQCKKDGWRSYGTTFRNQGDCVSFIATQGANAAAGSK